MNGIIVGRKKNNFRIRLPVSMGFKVRNIIYLYLVMIQAKWKNPSKQGSVSHH